MGRKKGVKASGQRVFLKILLWSGFGFIAILGAGYGWVRSEFASRSRALDAEIAKAKRFGIPLEPGEMDTFASVHVQDNAAEEILEVAKRLEPLDKRSSSIFAAGMRLAMRRHPEVLPTIRGAVAERTSLNAEIRQATAKPKFAIKRNWKDVYKLEFAQYAQLKACAKSLLWEANMAALDGNWMLVGSNLRAMGRIAEYSGQEPTIIGALVQVSISAIAWGAVTDLAELAVGNPSALNELRNAALDLPDAPTQKPYFKGEAYYNYQASLQIGKNIDGLIGDTLYSGHAEPTTLDRWSIKPPLIEDQLAGRFYAYYALRFWNEVFNLMEDPQIGSRQLANRMDELATRLDAEAKPWNRFVGLVMPVFSQFGVALDRSSSTRTAALAAIDLHLYKTKHGEFPEALGEATERFYDPYGDGKLRYQRTANGFRVVSIGPDGVFANGLTRGERSGPNLSNVDDIGVVYPQSERSTDRNEQDALDHFHRVNKSLKPVEASTKPIPKPAPSRLVQ